MQRTLTTSQGAPVDSNQHSLTAGTRGPILLQDVTLLDKLAKFDRERIPERVAHARGAGAHGYFEVTHDLSKFTKAKFLNQVGKKTPLFVRFSTTGGESGSSDTARDIRGFAIKMYTEDGNYDMVGNNSPTFWIRDPMKFPDLIHSQKKNPATGCKDPNMTWDFRSYQPEGLLNLLIVMSDRGVPDGYRHMDGFSSHTYKWVNETGEAFWVKYTLKTDQGNKCLNGKQIQEIEAKTLDYATDDLYENIAKGSFPSWTWSVQLIPEKEGYEYKYDIFDLTKVWHHSDYPLIPLGKLVLNRNSDSFFADSDQVAFSPANLVPGVEPSPDKILQGRMFSYPDTQRHRLGANFEQIPINCPYRARVSNYQRDGPARVDDNGGKTPNYEPNSLGNHAQEDPKFEQKKFMVSGEVGRYNYTHPNCDYDQPRQLFRRVWNDEQRTNTINNIVGGMKCCRKDIKERMVAHFTKIDEELGKRVGDGLGLNAEQPRL